MKKTLLAILLAVALIVIPVGSALALPSDTVTITATPTYISIDVTQTDFDFGVVAVSSFNDTTTSGPKGVGGTAGADDYFDIVNTSTIDIDIEIYSDSWDGGANDWTWGASDADTGQLNASTDQGSTWSINVPNSASNVLLFDGLVALTDDSFDLQLEAPSSFSYGNAQQTIVTVSATAD
ncbi:MAG: hypothetical protein HQ588_02265 [Deltaproteobacteria bacterium]|nr:hypothetical protein [Deltaproteobacteria bacterium]